MNTRSLRPLLACVPLLLSLAAAHPQSYSWTTIAGLASSRGSDDGTNSDARFYFPLGIAVDGSGTLYVTDLGNSTVRKITPIGTNWAVTTIAGRAGCYGIADGTNGDACFYNPQGVAVDSASNLFVVDGANNTIRKLTPDGPDWVVTTIAGMPGAFGSADGTNSDALFFWPGGIAVDAAGSLYVADSHNNTIRKITPVGPDWVVTTIAGLAGVRGRADGTNNAARFDWPEGVATDGAGNLYVTDEDNGIVRKLTPVGTNWVVTTLAGTNGGVGFADPLGLALDSAINLYVADGFGFTIRKLTPQGTNWVASTIGGLSGRPGTADGTNSDARFQNPWGAAVDAVGNAYVVDYISQTIRKGTPLASPVPSLNVSFSAPCLVLAWPLSASNYLLETSSTLSPVASWAALTAGVVTVANTFVLTNSPSPPAAFYRLHFR
jgi:hypothetical protein